MSIKQDLNDTKEEIKEVIENNSIALSILKDYKKQNKILSYLLGISILSNIIIILVSR